LNLITNFFTTKQHTGNDFGHGVRYGGQFMYANVGLSTDQERYLDNATAQLTEAAYLVALRHAGDGSWIDLKLDLWDVLTDTVHKVRRERPRGSAD